MDNSNYILIILIVLLVLKILIIYPSLINIVILLALIIYISIQYNDFLLMWLMKLRNLTVENFNIKNIKNTSREISQRETPQVERDPIDYKTNDFFNLDKPINTPQEKETYNNAVNRAFNSPNQNKPWKVFDNLVQPYNYE